VKNPVTTLMDRLLDWGERSLAETPSWLREPTRRQTVPPQRCPTCGRTLTDPDYDEP
jgi:hypothetical protein